MAIRWAGPLRAIPAPCESGGCRRLLRPLLCGPAALAPSLHMQDGADSHEDDNSADEWESNPETDLDRDVNGILTTSMRRDHAGAPQSLIACSNSAAWPLQLSSSSESYAIVAVPDAGRHPDGKKLAPQRYEKKLRQLFDRLAQLQSLHSQASKEFIITSTLHTIVANTNSKQANKKTTRAGLNPEPKRHDAVVALSSLGRE